MIYFHLKFHLFSFFAVFFWIWNIKTISLTEHFITIYFCQSKCFSRFSDSKFTNAYQSFKPQLKLYLEKKYNHNLRFERCFDMLHKETKQLKQTDCYTTPVTMNLLNFFHYLRPLLLNMHRHRRLWLCENFTKSPLHTNYSKGIFTVHVIWKRSQMSTMPTVSLPS